jgi:hypothetical protein
MGWTADQQNTAQTTATNFLTEYQTAYTAWQNAIQAGNPAQNEASVQDVLRRWRAFTQNLREQSDDAVANEAVMDILGALVADRAELQQTLAQLESEAGTRTDQADSLNPKPRQSPYTNILGLQRVFRESTRTAIFWVSVVFAVLALLVLAYLIYATVVVGADPDAGTAVTTGFRGGGGAATKSRK